MDIKAIINLMAFEIKAQLKTKAFWLLAILPPLALIAMFWLNTTNTVSNNIYVTILRLFFESLLTALKGRVLNPLKM